MENLIKNLSEKERMFVEIYNNYKDKNYLLFLLSLSENNDELYKFCEEEVDVRNIRNKKNFFKTFGFEKYNPSKNELLELVGELYDNIY